MKLPTMLQAATRNGRQRAKTTRHTTAAHAGVVPQDAWCEEVCQETYPRGSQERATCMKSCWAN